MANQEHFAIFRQGVEVWNKWRANNPEIKPDLSGEDLSQTTFCEADRLEIIENKAAELRRFRKDGSFNTNLLMGINFSHTNLSEANLCRAFLFNADLNWASLISANLAGAYLGYAKLYQAKLINVDLRCADLEGARLESANLSFAKLMWADIREANLKDGNLSQADLTQANLKEAKTLAANFCGATLTGACLKNWHCDSTTNFDGVICHYVYLEQGQQERCPLQGNFAPGEFTKRYQKYTDTFDWVFHHGVNWVALAYSFKFEWERDGIEIKIKGIEEIDDGVIRIRVKVPSEADKGTVETRLRHNYEQLLALACRQQGEIRGKEGQIALMNTTIAQLLHLLSLSRPGIYTQYYYNNGDTMSDKRSDIKIGDVTGSIGAFAGGDISGVAGQNMTGVAGGDISGTVTNTINELKASDEPEAPQLADLLKQLQTAIQQNDSGLSQKDKEKALNHLNAIGTLGSDCNNPDFKEMAENALDALPTILKRGAGLLTFVETHFKTQLDTILENIRVILNL